MLGYYTTFISLPCLKDLVSNQGFNVGIHYTIKHMNSLPCIKDLASSQGFDAGLLYDPCLKDLVSSQGFNVGIQSNV